MPFSTPLYQKGYSISEERSIFFFFPSKDLLGRKLGLSKERCVLVLSYSVVSNSLQLHGLQPAMVLCPLGFSRQELWSGLPCPPPGNLHNPGIKPRCPALQVDSLPSEPQGKWFSGKIGKPISKPHPRHARRAHRYTTKLPWRLPWRLPQRLFKLLPICPRHPMDTNYAKLCPQVILGS